MIGRFAWRWVACAVDKDCVGFEAVQALAAP